ncbi:hypothetical protein DL96DRAFT_1715173 [Flagelloscypha sp. PMI_526]|nr:hypothetical protein DL96DRAFT_1715173 [Flagelloscypha sp. PMI_526]
MPAKPRKAATKASTTSKSKKDNAKPTPKKDAVKTTTKSWLPLLPVAVALLSGILGYGLPFLFPRFLEPEPQYVYDAELEALRDHTLFRTEKLPGKGIGVVAVRDIQQGELLVKEKPVIVVPATLSVTPQEYLAEILPTLSQSKYDAFFNLSYHSLPEHITNPSEHPDELALAIIQTNGVAAGHSTVGVFPRMARINHACAGSFNAVYNWRDDEGLLVVHAFKPIPAGSEITTSYFDTKLPRSERQAGLLSQYGFNCTCSTCSLPPAESLESDARLTNIAGLYSNFSSWGWKGISGSEAIENVRKIWELEDVEGYWSERGRLAADAVYVAATHGDRDAVKEWAEVSAEWFGYEIGKDSIQVLEMRQVQKNPEGHPNWKDRDEERVGGPKRMFE